MISRSITLLPADWGKFQEIAREKGLTVNRFVAELIRKFLTSLG